MSGGAGIGERLSSGRAAPALPGRLSRKPRGQRGYRAPRSDFSLSPSTTTAPPRPGTLPARLTGPKLQNS